MTSPAPLPPRPVRRPPGRPAAGGPSRSPPPSWRCAPRRLQLLEAFGGQGPTGTGTGTELDHDHHVLPRRRYGSTVATIPSGTATVDVGTTDLGQVLVDLSGHTLYVFTADAAGTPTCVDDSCTKVWPPLTGTGIAVGGGVPTSRASSSWCPDPTGPAS